MVLGVCRWCWKHCPLLAVCRAQTRGEELLREAARMANVPTMQKLNPPAAIKYEAAAIGQALQPGPLLADTPGSRSSKFRRAERRDGREENGSLDPGATSI